MKPTLSFSRPLAIALLVLAAGSVSAQDAKIVKVEYQPQTIELKNPFAYRQLLITGITEAGERIDVTRQAQIKAPDFLKVAPSGQVRPAPTARDFWNSPCRDNMVPSPSR